MSRHPTKENKGGPGPITSSHPLGASSTGFDHAAHRKELFGDDRQEALAGEVEGPDEAAQKGGHATEAGWVDPEEAAGIYGLYYGTDLTQEQVARAVGRSRRVVAGVVTREGRFEEMTEEIAEEMGHPDEGES